MPKKEKMFKIYFEVPQSMVRTVMDVIEGVGQNQKFIQIQEDAPPVSEAKNSHKVGEVAPWALLFWPDFKAIFLTLPAGTMVRHDDERFRKVMRDRGHADRNLSPVWSTLMRAGYVDRPVRGSYRMIVK